MEQSQKLPIDLAIKSQNVKKKKESDVKNSHKISITQTVISPQPDKIRNYKKRITL